MREKEKRHSKEHRHREKHRERDEKHHRHGHMDKEREMRHHHSSIPKSIKSERHFHYKDRLDAGNSSGNSYNKEKERIRDDRPPREKKSSDADRILEDLRSRLLSKKNRMESEKHREREYIDEEMETYEYNKYRETKDFYDKSARRGKDYDKRDAYYQQSARSKVDNFREKREFVEIIDSPENYNDGNNSERRIEDREQEARRTKFLEAAREKAKRKEDAEARLELRRERADYKRDSLSPEAKRKREYSSDELEEQYQKSNPTDANEEEEGEDKEDVVMVSDQSDDSNSESDSSTNSEVSREPSIEPPESPLSVGELSKSERRQRSATHSKSRSRSTSAAPSRSQSRSPSRTPSSTKSKSESDEGKPEENSHEADKSEEKIKQASPEVEPEEDVLPPYYPAIQGCRSVEEFQCLNRIEEGTYGVVYRARDKRTLEIVALKRLKMEKEKEGFPITSLREINTLLKGQHPNIVTVREIVVGSNMDKIFIVMDYVEHDLKSLMETMKQKNHKFFPAEVKCLIQQLLKAVGHLHDNWILHRDLKTSNLLLSHKGILKVGDFGLAREYGSPLKAYTSIVVTLWYRAPELLLCCKEYSTPIDIWSVGCIFAEFLSMSALFPGKSEVDQLNRIFKDLGTPNERIWPGYNQLPAVQKMTFTEYPVSQLRKKFSHLTSELGLSLLQGLLTYDPKQRLTADGALKNSYFKELPLPIDPAMFPTYPAKSEVGLKAAMKASSPKPPSGGGEFKKLGEDLGDNQGFHLGGSYGDSRHLSSGPGFSLKF